MVLKNKIVMQNNININLHNSSDLFIYLLPFFPVDFEMVGVNDHFCVVWNQKKVDRKLIENRENDQVTWICINGFFGRIFNLWEIEFLWEKFF